MKVFYAAKNNGFYNEAVHGSRTVIVPDPEWVRPTVPVPDPAWVPGEGDQEAPMLQVPDMSAIPPTVEQPNPECTLPPASELVEISNDVYRSMFDGQTAGKQIVAGKDGAPLLVDEPQPTTEQMAASALVKCDSLLSLATTRIAPLQDAVDLDDATARDIANLKKWKQYRVAVSRVSSQSTFPHQIVWPVEPS